MDIQNVLKALEKNRMSPYFVQTRADVVPLVDKIMADKKYTVAEGGSITLSECGVIDYIKSKHIFIDRASAKTPEEKEELKKQYFSCDFLVTGTNALTEDGVLYNVDGYGNRVAAITHGPRNIIIVVGINKIVRDLNEAALRVKTIAAPANCVRLGKNTYCAHKGRCESLLKANPAMTDGCSSEDRICCDYVITGFQRAKGRIRVIIVNESLGY